MDAEDWGVEKRLEAVSDSSLNNLYSYNTLMIFSTVNACAGTTSLL